MRLVLDRVLACPPEVAFSYLTDPDRMNEWSLAEVRSTHPGDGGHPAGVGALRRVILPMRPRAVLEEVVERCDPPTTFRYRVIGGAPVRDHTGHIEVQPEGSGTRVRWTVEAAFPVGALELVVRRALLRDLERSLDRLEQRVRAAGKLPVPSPPRRDLSDDDPALLGEVTERAIACREEQRQLADELGARGDGRFWFTRVYQHVTDLQIDACRQGRYAHAAWVLRLIADFHEFYRRSLLPALGRAPGRAESHWLAAFTRMAQTEGARWDRGRFEAMGYAVFFGMKAHIEEDLPRALARTYARHYRGRCDYVRFRADYFAMAPIFADAGNRLLGELRPGEVPLSTRILDGVLPREVKDLLMARRLYDIPRERRRAFARGERLVELID